MFLDVDPRLPSTPKWVWLTMVVDIVIFGVFAVTLAYLQVHSPTLSNFVYAAVWIVPYYALAVLLRTRPSAIVIGSTIAISLGSTLSLVLLPAAFMSGGSPGETMVFLRFAVLLLVFVLVHLLVVLWGLRTLLTLGWGPAVSAIGQGMAFMVFWPVAAWAIAETIAAPIERYEAHRRDSQRAELVRSIMEVQRCAFVFEARHPSAGFPASLQALAADGAHCLSADIASGHTGGFTLRYGVTGHDSAGRASTFTVTGRVNDPEPDVGRLAVHGDETAAVRRGWVYDDDSTERFPPDDGIPRAVDGLRNCVELFRKETGQLPTKSNMYSELNARAKRPGNSGMSLNGCDPIGVRDAADPDRVDYFEKTSGYRLTYLPTGGGYSVEARPVKYGVTALRSYMMADDGKLYVTRNDRGARDDDDELPPCLPFDVGDCVPTQPSAAPRASFVMDTVIRIDKPYKLSVRVDGAADRAPKNLRWAFQCTVSSDSVVEPPPRAWRNSDPDENCPTLTYRTPSLGDSVTARLWIRNAFGATAHLDSRSRIEMHPKVFTSPFGSPP